MKSFRIRGDLSDLSERLQRSFETKSIMDEKNFGFFLDTETFYFHPVMRGLSVIDQCVPEAG